MSQCVKSNFCGVGASAPCVWAAVCGDAPTTTMSMTTTTTATMTTVPLTPTAIDTTGTTASTQSLETSAVINLSPTSTMQATTSSSSSRIAPPVAEIQSSSVPLVSCCVQSCAVVWCVSLCMLNTVLCDA